MRTKIRVEGKWYKPVPWLQDLVPGASECDGCAFGDSTLPCLNTSERNNPCDDGNEFSGMIFIRATKAAMAAYVAKRLGVTDETLLG